MDPDLIVSRADYPACVPAEYQNVPPAAEIKGKSSLFMRRTASRILLEIVGVRMEQLQDISEADARAEGARECDPLTGREALFAGRSQGGSHVLHYQDIWEQINGAGSWEANP